SFCTKQVKIVFLDNKSITGIVNQFSRYHIVLEVEGKDEIITVFKHAIKYILSKKKKLKNINKQRNPFDFGIKGVSILPSSIVV
ncbi:RNA chaperone Hfq, partial [Heyndrickxia coagulans]|uniref:RNA chaperone Hfq n=1 Tax=Heyndrickxia coagulans TaxID=1398 RepID=UPI002E1BEC02